MFWRNKVKNILNNLNVCERDKDSQLKNINSSKVEDFSSNELFQVLKNKCLGKNKEEVGTFLILLNKFKFFDFGDIQLKQITASEEQEKEAEYLYNAVACKINDFIEKNHGSHYSADDIQKLHSNLLNDNRHLSSPESLVMIINKKLKEQAYRRFQEIINIRSRQNVNDCLERFIEVYGVELRQLEEIRILAPKLLRNSAAVEELFNVGPKEQLSMIEKEVEKEIDGGVALELSSRLTISYIRDFASFIEVCADRALKVSFLKNLLAENELNITELNSDLNQDEKLISFVINQINLNAVERKEINAFWKRIYNPEEIGIGIMLREYSRPAYEIIKNTEFYPYISNFADKYMNADSLRMCPWQDDGLHSLQALLFNKKLTLDVEEIGRILSIDYCEKQYDFLQKSLSEKTPKALLEAVELFTKFNAGKIEKIMQFRFLAEKFGLIWSNQDCTQIINNQFETNGNEGFVIRYFEDILPLEMDFEESFFLFKRYLREKRISLIGANGQKLSNQDIIEMISSALKTFQIHNFENQLMGYGMYSIEDVDALNGFEFEKFLKLLFEKLGYKVTHTKLAGDQGADLVLDHLGELIVVQAKRSRSKISNSAIQEVVASIRFYKAKKGMVITNSEFTHSAIELAKSNNIVLIARKELEELIDNNF